MAPIADDANAKANDLHSDKKRRMQENSVANWKSKMDTLRSLFALSLQYKKRIRVLRRMIVVSEKDLQDTPACTLRLRQYLCD